MPRVFCHCSKRNQAPISRVRTVAIRAETRRRNGRSGRVDDALGADAATTFHGRFAGTCARFSFRPIPARRREGRSGRGRQSPALGAGEISSISYYSGRNSRSWPKSFVLPATRKNPAQLSARPGVRRASGCKAAARGGVGPYLNTSATIARLMQPGEPWRNYRPPSISHQPPPSRRRPIFGGRRRRRHSGDGERAATMRLAGGCSAGAPGSERRVA